MHYNKRHHITLKPHTLIFQNMIDSYEKCLITKIMTLKNVVNKKRGKAKLNKAKSVGRIGKECG